LRLREYQQRAIDSLRALYSQGKRAPVCNSPTGSGKTIIGAEIVRLTAIRGGRVLFNAHREELIEQTARKLAAAGITNIRTIRAAQDLGGSQAPVTVASVQTLTRWANDRMPSADLVVFDECHHVVAKTWKKIADAYQKSFLLGLTATMQRADGSPLGDVFDSFVTVATVRELTELGHLVPCRVWAPPQILETGELAVSPVDAYLQHGQGERAICFCVTKDHAAQIVKEFNDRGITAAVVHGQLSKTMRAQILAWFREGQIRVVCNVHVLTEGFDDPAASVGILCRKPEHVGTYLQMAGRILRPSPGKTHATLIDLCGSSLVHGTPDMERKFSLDGKGIGKTDREQIRQCPHCGSVFLYADIEDGCCPECGCELPKSVRREPRVTGVGLVDATGTDQLRANLQAVAKRTRRAPEWVDAAHAAIVGRRAA
jgi:DNA repair protein RadD